MRGLISRARDPARWQNACSPHRIWIIRFVWWIGIIELRWVGIVDLVCRVRWRGLGRLNDVQILTFGTAGLFSQVLIGDSQCRTATLAIKFDRHAYLDSTLIFPTQIGPGFNSDWDAINNEYSKPTLL